MWNIDETTFLRASNVKRTDPNVNIARNTTGISPDTVSNFGRQFVEDSERGGRSVTGGGNRSSCGRVRSGLLGAYFLLGRCHCGRWRMSVIV